MVKHTSDPKEGKIQVRDLVRVVGISVPYAARGDQYSGKIGFIEHQRVDGRRRPVPGAPISSILRQRQANVRKGTVWVL